MNRSAPRLARRVVLPAAAEQEQGVDDAEDERRDQLGQVAQVAPQHEKILLEDGKHRLGRAGGCKSNAIPACCAGRSADGGLLFAGDDLHAGPAGVIQALGSDQGKPEDAAGQPERGSHQQRSRSASDLLPAPPVPARPSSTAARVCWQAVACPARRVPETSISLPNELARLPRLRTDEGEHCPDKTQDFRRPARRQDAHHRHHQQAGSPAAASASNDHRSGSPAGNTDVIAAGSAQTEQHRQSRTGIRAQNWAGRPAAAW